jgi:hypothetical protein
MGANLQGRIRAARWQVNAHPEHAGASTRVKGIHEQRGGSRGRPGSDQLHDSFLSIEVGLDVPLRCP